MQKKKIFIDATGIVSTPDGLGKYSYFLLKSLLKKKRYKFSILHQVNIPKSHPLFYLGHSNVTFVPVDIPTIGPKRELIMFSLRKKINEYDIFHCLSSYLPAFGLRIPSVVTVHDLKYLLYPRFFDNRLKTVYYSWIIRRGIRNASHVIAVSEATKRDIVKLDVPSQKVHVIYEAPTISLSEKNYLPEILEGKKYWFFVGENRPHKNVRRIIAAYNMVKKKLGSQCPLFVFAGSKYETLKEKFLHNNFVFLGPVSEEILVSLYTHTLALIYPSLYEGFGLPILEAMALGTPVITSNCSSMPEVAGNAALLINPHDTTQIADAIIKLVKNDKERSRMRTRGLKRIRDFSWEKAANLVYGLYEKILS
jgi:glycosyltransferase involved in cell wall biosynthesis